MNTDFSACNENKIYFNKVCDCSLPLLCDFCKDEISINVKGQSIANSTKLSLIICTNIVGLVTVYLVNM